MPCDLASCCLPTHVWPNKICGFKYMIIECLDVLELISEGVSDAKCTMLIMVIIGNRINSLTGEICLKAHHALELDYMKKTLKLHIKPKWWKTAIICKRDKESCSSHLHKALFLFP